MDKVIVAALIAAAAAILTAVVPSIIKIGAEKRETQRKILEPLVEKIIILLREQIRLSNNFHRFLLDQRVRNRRLQQGNVAKWKEKMQNPQVQLKLLAPKLGFAIDEIRPAVTMMTRLPDWVYQSRNDPEKVRLIVDNAEYLCDYLKRLLRKCYTNGRPPNVQEVFKLDKLMHQLKLRTLDRTQPE